MLYIDWSRHFFYTVIICLSSWLHVFIAELRRPEGPPSGAPYSYRKEKETRELIFPWWSWPAALLEGAYARRRRRRQRSNMAQHGGHTPNSWLTQTSSLGLPFTSLILDIPVMINWHLSKQDICWTVSRDHIEGSSVQLIEVACTQRSNAKIQRHFRFSPPRTS